MGSSWSQDESSQPGGKPGETMTQTFDINFKGKVTISPAKQLPHNYAAIMKDADSPIDGKGKVTISRAKQLPHNYAAIMKDADSPIHDKGKVTISQAKQLPHNYAAIMKDADSPIDESSIEKLYDQLYAGVLLNENRKKFWVEKKFNNNCFMLFARDLSIVWAEDRSYWHWLKIKETTSDVFVDVAELLDVCWLEVNGKFETAKLSPGIMYEVAFVVMMKDPTYGWEVPVNLKLALPDGNTQEHKENLREKPKGQWIEIPAGQFRTSAENTGEIKFSLFEYENGKWKKGLVVKGVIIRPKN